MIVASISSQQAREFFNEAFAEADMLASQEDDLLEIITAYEKVHSYFRQILNLDAKRDSQLINDHQDCLEELIEYYEIHIKELINNYLPAAAKEIQNKIDQCRQALGSLNDSAKAASQARIDYLNHQNKMLIAAHNRGFLCHNIPMDGNCLFHAIAHQLNMHHITIKQPSHAELHVLLRSLAVKHIAANTLYYQERLSGITVQQYTQRLSNAGEWGDNIEIAALVRELNITLVLVENDERILIFKTNNSKPILYLGYERGLHFVSLQQMQGVPLNHELREQISIAPLVEMKDIQLQLPTTKTAYQVPIITLEQKTTPQILPQTNGHPTSTSKLSFQSFLNFFKRRVNEDNANLIPKTLRR
ncbi:MAG: hypothetical protein V4501_01850 [Pseudomonadota bacterium]